MWLTCEVQQGVPGQTALSWILKTKQNPFSYLQRSSDHSLAQSNHACIVHSCSRWSCHYTGRCGWRISEATSPCHHDLHTGIVARGDDYQQQLSHIALFLCWSHTHPLPRLQGMDNTGRSSVPREWCTLEGTGPKRGWHTGSPPVDPQSTR